MIEVTGTPVKRDGTADLLKGFAVLFMIQVHIMEQFVTPDIYDSMIGKISLFLGGPVCAPVFMAVMGYFLAVSARPLGYFLKRGIVLFLGGILLNVARSANLLLHIMRGEIILDPWFFIMGADILTLAGLSLILTGVLRLIYKERAFLYFFTALVIVAVNPLLNKVLVTGLIPSYITAYIFGTAGWSYFPLFPWFAYVLVGYAFCLFLRQTPAMKKIDVQNNFFYFIPLWITVILTLPYASAITHNLEEPGGYYHHGILFFGWVLLFMIAYLVLIRLIDIFSGDQRVIRLIKWMGQKVTVLYVIQWLIVGNIATMIYKTQNLFQFVGWFALVTAATLLTGFLFQNIQKRYLRKVSAPPAILR